MSKSLMLRQRQYVETLEGGSSIGVWSVLRGRRTLWAATFLEGPRSRDGKVKIRWAGYSKSSFHWVPSSDVHVPDEDLYIPHSVSKHRFKDGTKEYFMRWGNESYTWETEANESIRESGILDVYEMQMTSKVSKSSAATVFAVLRHEFSPRTGLTKVDMKSIKFCLRLRASGPPPEDHENDYGLVKKGSEVSVWLPIAEEWLHCVVAECCEGHDQIRKRRRSSATKPKCSVASKPSVGVRKIPRKRSSSSISCSNDKATDAFPKPQMQKASRRGIRRGGRGEAQPNSRGKEYTRDKNNGDDAPVHVPKNFIGDEEEVGGDRIPKSEARGDKLDDAEAPSVAELDELDLNEFYLGGARDAQPISCGKEHTRDKNNGGEEPVHVPKNSIGDEEKAGGDGSPKSEAHDELDDEAEAPSVAELDELDLNEFYLGGAPHSLHGLANGLQILDGVVTSYAIAQEFGRKGGNDDPFRGLSPAAVSIDGTYCNETDGGRTYSPDPESEDETFALPVTSSEEDKAYQLQSSCFPDLCLPCAES